VFGRIRGPFSVLLHSPKLAEKLLPMVPFAREGTVIDPKLRQIAILTAVRERDANYVWAAQVDVARRVGLVEPVIDVLRARATRRTWRRKSGTSCCTCGSSSAPTAWSSRRSKH